MERYIKRELPTLQVIENDLPKEREWKGEKVESYYDPNTGDMKIKITDKKGR